VAAEVRLTLDALAREDGTFLMVAMDQRESLRTMLAQHHADVDASRLTHFKLAVARELGPYASGFLIDRGYAYDALVREAVLPDTCGLILAADALVQPPGGAVEDTDLDDEVDAAGAAADGVAALKLLVIWRDDAARPRRVETAKRFVALARAHGLLSVLEPVVRGPEGFDREAAILEAAAELGAVGCDLYKCEVPTHGRGDAAEIAAWSRGIDAVLPCPWVVLSQGVEPERFPAAVEAACRGGASGILAGRAVWTAALAEGDPTRILRERSVPRLRELGAIVAAHATPWRRKAA